MTPTRLRLHMFFWSVFARFGIWFWYNLSQIATRRKHVTLVKYATPHDIIVALDYGNKYMLDPLKGKFDIMYHVTRIQERVALGKYIGDCEDHACYWLHSLLTSGLATEAWLGCIQFQRDGKIEGHALAVYKGTDGKMYWTDYIDPKPFDAEWDWARGASDGMGGELLGASLHHVMGVTSTGRLRLARGVVKVFHG